MTRRPTRPISSARRLTAGVAGLSLILAPGVAIAKGGGGVRAAGSCSSSSTATIKLKADNGRIETEFEVDQNRSGVAWRVTLRRNGVLAAATTATTKAPSGSFTVRRLLRNGPGADRVTALAVSPSGERCTAHARLG